MCKMVCVSGNVGSGKSTCARKIVQKVGGLVFDIDVVKRELVDPRLVTKQVDPPEIRWQCYLESFRRILLLFEGGASTVVVDEVFHLQDLRTRLEDCCITAGVEVFWVHMQCSYAQVERRLQARAREGHILSTAEALKMYLLFEGIFEPFPADKPNHIVYNNDGDGDIDALVLALG